MCTRKGTEGSNPSLSATFPARKRSPSGPKTRSAALCGLPPPERQRGADGRRARSLLGVLRHRSEDSPRLRRRPLEQSRPGMALGVREPQPPRAEASRSTRFSACRYAMASCCRRWIQPATRKTKNWNGAATFGDLTARDDSRRSSPRQRAPRLRTPQIHARPSFRTARDTGPMRPRTFLRTTRSAPRSESMSSRRSFRIWWFESSSRSNDDESGRFGG